MRTLVVNLFGSPGSGKSTGAAYIFSKLKMKGVNAELVTEFAKDKVWEGNTEVFKNQAYIFGKQYFKISRVLGKVDVIITDSPILLSLFYNDNKILDENFNDMILNVFNSFNSLNYLLDRDKPYNSIGRFQTEEQSDALKQPMRDLLENNNIKYQSAFGSVEYYDKIIEDILERLDELK